MSEDQIHEILTSITTHLPVASGEAMGTEPIAVEPVAPTADVPDASVSYMDEEHVEDELEHETPGAASEHDDDE